MKKYLIALVVVLGSVGYVAYEHTTAAASDIGTTIPVTGQDANTTATDAGITVTANTPVTASDPTPAPAQPPATAPATATKTTVVTPVTKPSGAYKDGTYVGSVADAYYGNMQVEAIISGGRLSTVKVLQYPSDRRTSIEINQQALPMLITEAVSAQSANIDGISGASASSPAFIESLRSALAKAKA